MLKRIFALVFSLLLLTSFAACSGGQGDTQTDLSSDGSTVSSVTDATTETSNTSTTSDKGSGSKYKKPGPPLDAPQPTDPNAVVYDPEMEHMIICCDVENESIVVLDLNKCKEWTDVNKEECKVWEWNPRLEKTCQYFYFVGNGIDDAKLRYSSYYKTDVVIATSSKGWAAVIEYPSGKVLWESPVSYGPHSIEMLPNGDVVVASSGGNNWSKNGTLFYFALSSGSTTVTSSINLPSAHGLCWDPEQKILWGLGMDEITGYRVIDGGTSNARLEAVDGKRVTFLRDNGGHDLSPVFGQPGKYWATCVGGLWLFDSHTMTVTKDVDYHAMYTGKDIKGLAYFADGTMIQSRAGIGTHSASAYGTTKLIAVTIAAKESDPSVVQATRQGIQFKSREFYKVHTFTKNYQ